MCYGSISFMFWLKKPCTEIFTSAVAWKNHFFTTGILGNSKIYNMFSRSLVCFKVKEDQFFTWLFRFKFLEKAAMLRGDHKLLTGRTLSFTTTMKFLRTVSALNPLAACATLIHLKILTCILWFFIIICFRNSFSIIIYLITEGKLCITSFAFMSNKTILRLAETETIPTADWFSSCTVTSPTNLTCFLTIVVHSLLIGLFTFFTIITAAEEARQWFYRVKMVVVEPQIYPFRTLSSFVRYLQETCH